MNESVKVRLFKLLQASKDHYISGADLARNLMVSRNAIWKAVESLRTEGYDISAITNKGYRMNCGSDVFSQTGIAGYIKTSDVFRVELRKSVTSTNTILREMATKGAPECLVLVAEEQTAGKGRQGRSFHSPADYGVYFSILLRPDSIASEAAALITSAAAVATAQAIEEVVGVKVGIKWVNDLFMDGKKVCGILTEAVTDLKSGSIGWVVIGIGVNVTTAGFPAELSEIAGSIGVLGIRNQLAAAIIDELYRRFL